MLLKFAVKEFMEDREFNIFRILSKFWGILTAICLMGGIIISKLDEMNSSKEIG